MEYQVYFKLDNHTITLIETNVDFEGNFGSNIGSIQLPDNTYPGSAVAYHKIRDLLYGISAQDADLAAMFPDNITGMQKIVINVYVPAEGGGEGDGEGDG